MKVTFQALKWEVNETDENVEIYIHGLNRENKRVAVKIPDFKPYIYLELDPRIRWNMGNIELLKAFLREKLRSNFPVKNKIVDKKKIYYYQSAKFLWMAFNTKRAINHLKKIVTPYKDEDTDETPQTIYISGLGNVKLVVHEHRADPILQLFAMRKIKPSGWIIAKQTKKPSLLEEYDSDKFSTADIEILSEYKDISSAKDISSLTNPLIVSYDIECISGDKTGNTFPNAKRKTDQVICICATVGRAQSEESSWKIFSLVNEVNNKVCSNIKGSEVRHFRNEKELLIGWRDFIVEINPDVIIGYNTLSFDDRYLAERSDICLCRPKFLNMGRLIGQTVKTEERKWSSSAYGDQQFNFININGRLHIDMYPVIFKDYGNLPSYTLDTVSEYFIGDHKVDLPAKQMIQQWHRGEEKDIQEIVTYCQKDTILPFRLLQKLNTWAGITEMSNIVMVPIFDIVTRGQQIKVFSQIYCLAFDLNVVCSEKWADYKPTDEEKEYMGATVQNPKTGYWELVATYDFKSLYPTTIIAHNICPSTFIPENESPPEDQYHLLEWHDHSGCEHDTAIRKTKVSKVICKAHSYRFYKAEIKKGIIPILLENLLDARAHTRKEYAELAKKMEVDKDMSAKEREANKLLLIVLDKRQLALKIAANSVYGGLGSDFSLVPFYPAAASTTAMGRRSIAQAIDFAYKYRSDTTVIYGDTDSCMIKFETIKTLDECFQVCYQMEKDINKIFPKPMYLELEKIYSKYFLLSKKRYIGYIVDKTGKLLTTDKKGVVIKRRDNCGYLRKIYSMLIEMIMSKQPKWKIYEYLGAAIDDLLRGNVNVEQLIITKSIKDNYKANNLPHVAVAKKMQERGKYVASGTRIKYIFITTDIKNAPQYMKAEDPDFYFSNKDTIKIDYLYYLEKQIINPIDEVLEVKYGTEHVLQNLFKLIKKGSAKSAIDYFKPNFRIAP